MKVYLLIHLLETGVCTIKVYARLEDAQAAKALIPDGERWHYLIEEHEVIV